jgi:acyl-CoA-binding protein
MITYFSEQDLVSFGNFILSPARKQAYVEQGINEDKLPGLLENINTFDLTTWFNLIVKQQQQAQQAQQNEQIQVDAGSDSK